MDIPSTFLRWAVRERPEMLDRHPGLREYIATRIGAEARYDNPPPPPSRPPRSPARHAPRASINRLPTPHQSPPKATPAPKETQADMFALARAMRAALE